MNCNSEKGCGTVSRVGMGSGSIPMSGSVTGDKNLQSPFPISGGNVLSYSQMTEYIEPQPDAAPLSADSSSAGISESVSLENNPAYSGLGPLIPNAPVFKVPSNPLLPPEYQELLSYDDLQYLNGFLRTQIGKYMRVEQLVGSNLIEERYGYLVGVGNNYIILQELSTDNIMALDYYNIKMVYIYLSNPSLPTNSGR